MMFVVCDHSHVRSRHDTIWYDKLNGDGLSVWDGLQAILNQYRGVQEIVGCARVDKGLEGDGRLTWY